jgi:uncharacterized membrane protein
MARSARKAPGGVRFCAAALPCIAALFGRPAEAETAVFIPLGDLPGGAFESRAAAISGDGRVVIGSGSRPHPFTSGNSREAFRWTADSGMVGIGILPGGAYSDGLGISGDGRSIVGQSGSSGSAIVPFRWKQSTGITQIPGVSTEHFNRLWDASYAADVMVGEDFWYGAFRWTKDDGTTTLEGGQIDSTAYSVSDDGMVVVGARRLQGFRWTADSGFEKIGAPYGSVAYDISADGSTIIGWTPTDAGLEAFRWTRESGLESLGDLDDPDPLLFSVATGVSGDGSVVVGRGSTPAFHAFVWTREHGMQMLQDVLSDRGAHTSGWVLRQANAVSEDGLRIAGEGVNPEGLEEAWLAVLLTRCSDGIDNDGDGKADSDDPACSDPSDDEERPRDDVEIEVLPRHKPIRPMSRQVVAVAIWGTETGAVEDIEGDSIVFGPAGAPPLQEPAAFDLDRDGDADLLAFFRADETGLAAGDTIACIDGVLAGEPFVGCDEVVVVPGAECGRGAKLALVLTPLLVVMRRLCAGRRP